MSTVILDRLDDLPTRTPIRRPKVAAQRTRRVDPFRATR